MGSDGTYSLKCSCVVIKKIARTFIDEMELKTIEKNALYAQYERYIDAILSMNNSDKSKTKKIELKGKYFKYDKAYKIELLNTLIKNAAKITKELGISSLYDYFIYCDEIIENSANDLVNSSRLAEILRNAATKIIKPFIETKNKLSDKYSQKFISLIAFLEEHFKKKQTQSSIIFINERIMAYLLHKALIFHFNESETLPQIGLVMGNSLNYNAKSTEYSYAVLKEISTVTMETSQQLENIEKFRNQTYQLLVATDIVEEGMDIPTCNLVCCFNSIKNVKSFVQMQGRARDKNSHFVILIPEKQSAIVSKQISEYQELIEIEKKISLYVEKSIEPEPEAYKTFKLSDSSYIEVPQTGAKVCIYEAKNFLIKYCQCLPYDEYCSPFINYSYEEVKQDKVTSYIGSAILPSTVPKEIRYYTGSTPYPTKDAAIESVAFEIIAKLIELKKLNSYLLSTSKYGYDPLMKEINVCGLEYNSKNNDKYASISLLNETKLLKINEPIELYLYNININPLFPYLNQENSLGFVFFKDDLAISDINLIMKNDKIFQMMSPINEYRQSLNKDKYINIISNLEQYYAEKIKSVYLTVSLSKPIPVKFTYEQLMKLKCFHYYTIYATYNADFAFFQRICSGKDDFAMNLFKQELVEIKDHLHEEDSKFVMSKAPSKEELILHVCLVPLLKDNVFNYALVDEIICHIKRKLELCFSEEFSRASINELKGVIVSTINNNGRYMIFGNSEVNLKSNMLWQERIERKVRKLSYWSYYKIRYNLALNIAGNMALAKKIDTAVEKLLTNVTCCYKHNVFNELRSKKLKEIYLQKLNLDYFKDKNDIWINLPLELCKKEPLPIELYELARNTPVIFSVFNDMTNFKKFKEEFFGPILISPNAGNKLFVPVNSSPKVSLANSLKLHLLTEALTSGSARGGYSYERLEFLGDAVLRILDAWESYISNPNADIGELFMNKLYKLSNKRLAQIGYKLGFNKLLRVIPTKGVSTKYIPPGFETVQEYLEIINVNKNFAYNTIAFNKSRSNMPFLNIIAKNESSTEEEINTSSDEEEKNEKVIDSIKRSVQEYENEEEVPFEEAVDTPQYDLSRELKESKKKYFIISDKMVADTIVV